MDASINDFTQNFLLKVGKAGLHSIAPDNFEYYMCSFELLDSSGETKAFMMFPIMPNSIVQSKPIIASITKTNKGIATLFNSTFVPIDISIQGTFGRKFKILSGSKEIEDSVSKSKFFAGNIGIKFGNDSLIVKTGYGMMKMMEKIIDESTKLDENSNPCILIFNNYAFNTHYIVEVMQSSFSQNIENNVLWYYNLEMKAVAPAEAVKKIESENQKFIGSVASKAVVDSLGGLLKNITKMDKKII